MGLFQEGEGGLSLLRQVQIQHHAGVVGAQHLGLGISDLVIGVVDLLLVVVVQGHIAVLLLLIDEQDHIHGGDGVAVDPPHDGAVVVLLVRRIGGVQHAGLLIAQVHHLGELPGGQLVGQAVAGLGLHIGQPHGVVHLVHGAQLPQNGLFAVRVPPGHHQRHDILAAEGVVHPVLRRLVLIAPHGHHGVVPVHIGAAVGQHKAPHHTQDKDGHPHIPQGIYQLAPAVDLGDEILVAGTLHGLGKQHQQAGHQGKHRQHAQEDRLDQHQAQIEADAELHEHHGGQTGDGGQAAGRDRGDRRADGDDAGRAVVRGVLPLLQEAVQQDDGVVDGQGQLQDHGHRVGDEGDLPKDKVGALVQHGRRNKGDQQHGHLGIGPGGEQQHNDDNDGGHRQNDPHLAVQRLRLGVAHVGGDGGVIGLQQLLYRRQAVLGCLVVRLPPEGHGDQGVRPLHIVLHGLVGGGGQGGLVLPFVRVPEVHRGHPLRVLQPVGQLPGRVIGHVGDDDPGGGIGLHLIFHQGQAPAGLCALRQVLRQVVAHPHPALGEYAGDDGNDIEEKDQIPFVHDKRSQLVKKAVLLRLIAHKRIPFLWRSRRRPSMVKAPQRGSFSLLRRPGRRILE